MSSIAFLNALVAALPLLEVISQMTSGTVDDWLVRLARRLEGNDELIEELAAWLALPPGFEARLAPNELSHMSLSLMSLRNALWRTNGGKAA